MLQAILNSVVKSKGDLVSVLNATLTTIHQAQVNPSDNNESDSFGFVVEGIGDTLPLYAGGFAGELDATVIGDKDGNAAERIIVNKLRSVNAKYYAGGFFGYADVKGVADVSDNDETYLVGGLLDVGEVNVLAAFRPYIYYSEVNGVDDGIIVRAHNEGTNSLFSETRKTGCAGGFGGAMMDGTVRNSRVTRLNTVVAKNYTGGFIGHMGKSGVVNANGAQLTQLLGATAGVFDIMSTHTYNCDVIGIPNGAVINATGGSEPIAGGFVGYADVSKINNCHVQNLKQVTSDEIAGGFAGRTDRHYLVSVEAGSPLVQGVTLIVNALLAGLLVNDLQSINLVDLNLGILEVELLGEGKNACLVIGARHTVGNGDLAGITHKACAAGEDKEVPAQQLDELSFKISKSVAFNGMGLECKGPLLAGSHSFGKIRGGRARRELFLVMVGCKFPRNAIWCKLADRCVKNAVD